MQRKKNTRSKSPDPALERKSTLRKKAKTKQDESLKSNIVTSSESNSSDQSSSESSEEEIVVSKKSKSNKEKQEKKEKAEAKDKPKPKPIKKTGKPDPLVAGYEEEVVLGSADDCLVCADGGQILCCDNCFRAFHMKCIRLREKPQGDWLCPYCEDLKENSDICANCQESISKSEHYELLTCSKCLKNMHWGCSDVPLSLIVDNPFNKNFIFEPEVVKELKQNLLKHQMEPEDLIKQLYNKHAFEYLFHICNECVTTFGIQKIKNNVKTQVGDGPKDFYLAKLKRASDIHCAWLPEATVEESSKLLLRHFKRNFGVDSESQELTANVSDSDEENPLGQDESFRVERILACKRPLSASKKNIPAIQEEIMGLTAEAKTGLNNYKFLIKWEDMEYHYVTWEDEFVVLKFKEKVTKYFESRKLKKKAKKAEVNESNTKLVRFTTQPNCFEGKLFEYQLIGVNWLTNQYIQRNNAILADEMGLGKTIQTLCLLKYLSSQFGLEGPFLIVAPTSTVFNWQREAAKWCPNFDVIIYGGDGVSRRKIMESEFVQGESRSELEPRFNMAITTYTFINQDIARLKKIKWEVVVVDEAQRLKNRESKLYNMCADLETNFKLLLTGTPIQNTIDELISLVRYIIPNKPKLLGEIDDLTAALVTKNPTIPIVKKDSEKDEEREEALKKLKGILKNHMLRRTVQDAGLNFPELEEKIVKLNLTTMQKHLYKNILLKNYSVLTNAEAFLGKQLGGKGKRGGEGLRISLINVLTHLRLVCNHPDLFYSRSFNYDTNEESFREIMNASNKLKFLDKVMPRLLDAGHKILMFTQFVLMLDIIEEFLIFKNYEYDRLDGTTRNSDRQKIIDSFNNGRSKIFILSTRAGGLGINLTSSDTVIFVDSDFNPYRDIQAFCRAYRIGQKNKVMVYRLVSKFTVEEKIVENATKKLMLGEMIINPIDQSKSDKSMVESILRHGAMELFDKTFDQENDDEITEEKLDELLSREAKPIITNQRKPKTNDLNDFYLSGFNFIDFSFAPIIQQANTQKSSKEDKYWETLLAQDHADYEKDNVEVLGKGKRTKRTLQNQPNNIPLPTSSPESSSDSASEASEPRRRGDNKSDHSSEEEEETTTTKVSQVVLPENLMNYYNQLGSLFEETKEKGLDDIIRACGLPDLTRLKFLEFVMKFGINPFRAEDVYKNFCLFIEQISGIVKMPDSLTFRHYLKHFYCALLYEADPTPLTEYFFFKASPQVVRKRVVGFLNLKNKVNYYRAKPEKFKVRSKRYKKLFEEDGKMETEDDDEEDKWDNIDDYYLFDGISRYGMEEWDRIMKDSELWDRAEPKAYEDGDVWKLIFKKIEDKEPPENKELECVQYIREYFRVRSNLLMNMLLEEKEKKSTKEDV